MITSQNRESELILSPEGHIYLSQSDSAFQELCDSFAKGSEVGLLYLAIHDFGLQLPVSFVFWQNFSRKFITKVCRIISDAESALHIHNILPERSELEEVLQCALCIKGSEYLTYDVLTKLWQTMAEQLRNELHHFGGTLQEYLKQYNPRWSLVGRICFHLAENKNDEQRPFAFLATYTTKLTSTAEAQHLPLKRALQEYAGDGKGSANQQALLQLLLPIQRASNKSPFIKNLADSGSIFQTQAWTAHEAHKFLQSIQCMEESGIMVRVPNWWSQKKPPRPKVEVQFGEKQNALLGLGTLLNFDVQIALGSGEKLTRQEWNEILNSTGNLIKIKGQWVEVDREKLQAVLSHWDQLKDGAAHGLSMAESLRLLAGGGVNILSNDEAARAETTREWSMVSAGSWLKTILDELRAPSASKANGIENILKKHLQATLRPYQLAGVQWLWFLYQLKLGGCLADDMGLGKTIQILSLFLAVKHEKKQKKPHLLIVPASLLGNWQQEALRFAPSLNCLVAHSSVCTNEERQESLKDIDVVITTYNFVHRLPWLKEIEWDILVLDEAQLIKNPGAKQTLAVKELKGQVRFALSGTPVENRLGDLWSLFDFTSPGLLGSSRDFTRFSKKVGKENDRTTPQYQHFMSTLRSLTQPYILRRLKSDKSIITDLPEKTEIQSYCSLTKEQVQLYQESINELAEILKKASGIERRGLVLSYLLRFKQICNHPAQMHGYGDYAPEASGKFIRLREICEEIAAKQEKVLVFTQFREIIPALMEFLSQIFGREGLMLHGEIEVKKRAALVSSFQEEQGPPFFVLSLKAGGTGLTLTRASHVIHFDRWWNPSVENQATDRAYRIGQKQHVLVHKFTCRGTIEEKIDALITSKKQLSEQLLEEGGEVTLTELSNEELLKILSLDLRKASEEV